jgi:hypothetical protein
VAAIINRREDGWRKPLLDVFESGMDQGVWTVGIQPRLAVELVIATVKGAGLRPRGAAHALKQLCAALIRNDGKAVKRLPSRAK